VVQSPLFLRHMKDPFLIKLVEVSGLLEKLQPGDEIMVDKGFTIQDLLIPYGVRLNMPPLPFSQQSDGSK